MMYRSLILLFSLFLASTASAVPLTAIPASQITGTVSDESSNMRVQDGIAIWWKKHGSSKNVLELYFFAKKLTPQERKAFTDRFRQGAVSGQNEHPVFSLPRLVVLIQYKNLPDNFSKGKIAQVSSGWFPNANSVSGGTAALNSSITGLVWDGGEITIKGTGGPEEPRSPGPRWDISGTLPLIFSEV